MKIEYEATFLNVSKDEIRNKLKDLGGKLIQPELMLKRNVLELPEGHQKPGGFARVRDEGNKITMSVKQIKNGKMDDQRERCVTVNDFNEAKEILEFIGCESKAYQESKRETWEIDGVEIMIDEWPYLEPYVEIEGNSEADVIAVSKKLGFDYKDAYFGAVDGIYNKKYSVDIKVVNNSTPKITFDSPNPFLK
ncbi:MAG: CYTH domain-containing protein [Patescibacteria group bacterium]